MNRYTIQDFVILNEVINHLENLLNEMLKENNGFSNQPTEDVRTLLEKVKGIVVRLKHE